MSRCAIHIAGLVPSPVPYNVGGNQFEEPNPASDHEFPGKGNSPSINTGTGIPHNYIYHKNTAQYLLISKKSFVLCSNTSNGLLSERNTCQRDK